MFSALSVIETATAMKTGNLAKLSEEYVTDCDNMIQGCYGGFASNVYKYIRDKGGVPSEKDYPYHAGQAHCDPKKNFTFYSPIKQCYTLPDNAEVEPDTLKHVLLQNSSISLCKLLFYYCLLLIAFSPFSKK